MLPHSARALGRVPCQTGKSFDLTAFPPFGFDVGHTVTSAMNATEPIERQSVHSTMLNEMAQEDETMGHAM